MKRESKAPLGITIAVLIGGLAVAGYLVQNGTLGMPDTPEQAAARRQADREELGRRTRDEVYAAATRQLANAVEIDATKFSALRMGMSLSEAQTVVGAPGKMIGESEVVGIRTAMVEWKGPGASGANATFQNGRLVAKAQFGL